MCVIAVVDTKRPTDEMVTSMYTHNSEGAGVAWREKNNKGVPVVKWNKGLTLEEVQALCKTLPMPFVAHFRISTVGGRKPALCHPFPIEKDVSLDLEGSTGGFVLFHNGHWTSWKHTTLETASKNGFVIPTGKWSDSRAMAWMAAYLGIGVLEFIDEKAIAFGPTSVEIFGQTWGKSNDVWVSNKFWESRVDESYDHMHGHWAGPPYKRTMCIEKRCTKTIVEGTDFCPEHQPVDVEVTSILKGGPTEDKPFRGNSKEVHECLGTESSGEVKQQETKEDQAGVRGHGEGGKKETQIQPEVYKALEAVAWVRSLNPCRIKANGKIIDVDTIDRDKRLEAKSKGIDIVGPM